MTFEDIKKTSKNKFCQIIKKAIQIRALDYLLGKQGKKGQEIKYEALEMAEYLLPNYQNISLEEQRSIFSMRNRMVTIPSNFPRGNEKLELCPCGELENTKHIYSCKLWTKEIVTDKPKYENIFSDNVFKQVKVNKYFVMNYKTREKYILEKKNENKEV